MTEQQPPQNQIDDSIRIGKSRKAGADPNENFVFIRDWLGRELTSKKDEILGKSAVIIQAAQRMVDDRNSYKTIQGSYTLMRNPLRRFIAESVFAKAAENEALSAAHGEMKTFIAENEALLVAEAEERKQAYEEDIYSAKINDANFLVRVEE